MAKKREKPASDAPRPARKAAIYTRQSRDRNAVFSSCDMQRSICKDFADGFGSEVCETFEDVGGSSESLDRPSLRRLLQSVEAGGVNRIIVYSVDRLTRKLLHLQVLLQTFEQHDVSLHVVTDPHFGSSASARLMSNIIAAASEFQQDLTRERLAEARAALKQKGRRVAGRVPYGYVTDRNSKQLIIDPTEAKRVRKIFELAVSGKRPQEIADYANGRKWQTRRDGAMWTARQVLKMLSNPTYAGMIHHGPGRLPGQHEAIVDHAMFEQVRAVSASRRSRKAAYAPASILFPLRRLIKCGRCHRAMTPCMNQRKYFRDYFYRCRSRAGGKPPCRNVSLRAFEIEDFISSIFEQSEEEHESSGNTPLEAIRSAWRELNMRTQTNLLATIIKEVIFDPDAGAIVVTLVDDAVERIMTAKSDGSPTR
jgi:site-specific DNA recombinase